MSDRDPRVAIYSFFLISFTPCLVLILNTTGERVSTGKRRFRGNTLSTTVMKRICGPEKGRFKGF